MESVVFAALRASLSGKAVAGTGQLLYGQHAKRVVQNREWVFVWDKRKCGGVDKGMGWPGGCGGIAGYVMNTLYLMVPRDAGTCAERVTPPWFYGLGTCIYIHTHIHAHTHTL